MDIRRAIAIVNSPPGGAARSQMDYKAISLGLERVGYREREPDPDDQRSKQILLTDRGVAAAGVIREAVGEVEAAWARQLGASRFAELRDLLLELQQHTRPIQKPERRSG